MSLELRAGGVGGFDLALGFDHGVLDVGGAFLLGAVARPDGGVEREGAGQRVTPDDVVVTGTETAVPVDVARPRVFAEKGIEQGESPAKAGVLFRP